MSLCKGCNDPGVPVNEITGMCEACEMKAFCGAFEATVVQDEAEAMARSSERVAKLTEARERALVEATRPPIVSAPKMSVPTPEDDD